ncbi:39S ribosomal protein L41, mitochondrial [Ochotona curzoniae]|uniref:39S ribosomal protein L41, mitochondrial n=1 Tax=Ochotona curzoniae TaxID=130825 RepID=UPI001B34A59E|nr:39S ribosomal protein L41, mitochondrial [Ochotona curzoniae]
MGVLSAAARSLVLRGADRMSQWTSKRGPRSFNKGRGAKRTGLRAVGGRFVQVPEMVPSFVVPDLAGFKLKPYVSYRAPAGTDQPLTAHGLFLQTVAPAVEKDFREGAFDPGRLDKYGFEHTQEGKLFQLYPKNFPR